MKEIKEYWNKLITGTKIMFKEFINKDTNKKQRANMWTFSRLVISFIIPIFMSISTIFNITSAYYLAISSIIYGGISDFFDGRSARKYHSTSEFGRFLDQISDKVFALMLSISLSLVNPLFILNIISELGIAITNYNYKKKYHYLDDKSTIIGKIKQWPLFASFILGFATIKIPSISTITNIFIAITTILQQMTITSYIIKYQKEIKLYEQETNDIIENNSNALTNNQTKENELSLKKEKYLELKNILQTILIENKIENNPKTLVKRK